MGQEEGRAVQAPKKTQNYFPICLDVIMGRLRFALDTENVVILKYQH